MHIHVAPPRNLFPLFTTAQGPTPPPSAGVAPVLENSSPTLPFSRTHSDQHRRGSPVEIGKKSGPQGEIRRVATAGTCHSIQHGCKSLELARRHAVSRNSPRRSRDALLPRGQAGGAIRRAWKIHERRYSERDSHRKPKARGHRKPNARGSGWNAAGRR